MKKVTQYQTTDGKTFAEKADAKLHQTQLDAAAVIRHEYAPLLTAAPEAARLLTALLADPTFFINALKPVAKLLGKGESCEPLPQAA